MSNIQKVIADTSILIDHLRGTSEDFKLLESLRIHGKIELLIPDVVITELFAGKDAGKKKIREIFNKLIGDLSVVGLTANSARKAGELIRSYPQIPDPFDFLIAAIAIEQNAYIATHNIKHFEQIPKVALYDFSTDSNSLQN